MNMLGRKGEGLKRVQLGAAPRTAAAAAAAAAAAGAAAATAATVTVTTTSGHVLTVSEFISGFDEAARRRLNSMNEKLRGLEMQMEALESEISRANDDSSMWS